jgi:hypothetical protein
MPLIQQNFLYYPIMNNGCFLTKTVQWQPKRTQEVANDVRAFLENR